MKDPKKNKVMVYTFLITCLLALLVGCGSPLENKLKNDVYLGNQNLGGMTKSQVDGIIKKMSEKIDTAPKDAKLDEEKWEITPESYGKKLNIEKTREALFNAKEGDRVDLIVEDLTPGITSDYLKSKFVEIGSFSTPLVDKQENRVDNIEVAADCINNEKVEPGEEFSFNGTLGRRTADKGYKKAPIIVKAEDGRPKKGYGVGGGICQLSSTLYNAAERGGLDITERHVHSKSVGYVPKGRDATVAYDSVDFKFRNNRQYPVIIKVFLTKSKVTVKIYENRV
ncbi:MAG: VanW family protein [Bacillota bacterium]